MASKISFITVIAGLLVVPGGQKSKLINAGNTPILLTDTAVDDALAVLTEEQAKAVKHAMFSMAPGTVKSLATGTYNVDLGDSLNASVILYSEHPEPKPAKPVVPKESETPLANGTNENQNPQ
ncbi:hypothetical protein [Spirosoma endophyticum]|uniref:Uncharacterized protein n=1 Tax=Spirosoma endophyticum TaxID=662367 RepID=A0A1I1UA47_9BACT|nr:hypothetical protein [Spirosoma endophyticum]SFD67639.1 hypothetical protein SAMN05216167_106186 [Spirosoma endophyticum]